MAGTCAYASGTMPDYFCVKLHGITNDNCSDCNVLNDTWLLPQDGGDACTYTETHDSGTPLCASSWTMAVNFGSGNIISFSIFVSPDFIFIWSKTLASIPVGNKRYRLNLTTLGSECANLQQRVWVYPTNTGVCGGDPHFIGFDGKRFDVKGKPNCVYNLLQDGDLQVSARFSDWTDKMTGMDIITISYKDAKIKFFADGKAMINGVSFGGNYRNDEVSASWHGSKLSDNAQMAIARGQKKINQLPMLNSKVTGAGHIKTPDYDMEVYSSVTPLARMPNLNIFFKVREGVSNLNPCGLVGQTLLGKHDKKASHFLMKGALVY